MEFLSKILIDKLISNNIIKSEDKEIYIYGFKQLLFMILNLITTVIIGIIFNKVFESILFMIFYTPIRVYAGGYHAKTHIKCYIFSILMLIAVLYILKLNLIKSIILVILLSLISSIIILLLAPIEDSNKPLDDIEKIVYRKRTVRNLIIILIIEIIFFIFNIISFFSCITISLICNAIMLILGKINNLVKNN